VAPKFEFFSGTLTWKELRTSGQKMAPRAGHTTVALRQHLFVFGGFTDDRKIFDDLHVLNVGKWFLIYVVFFKVLGCKYFDLMLLPHIC
jgi:hypothetical protein